VLKMARSRSLLDRQGKPSAMPLAAIPIHREK
jgi:hypothetical protein